MSDSLQLGNLELLSGAGGTYNVLDGQRGLGDPQAITQTIQTQLTMGSFVTGSFTDNRTIKLQVLIQGTDRLSLANADSALRSVVNSSTLQVLRWAPDGGYPLLFDTFRGQVDTQWSGKFEKALARIVTISMQALPFGRADTQRSISGSSAATIQLGNFAANPEYAYLTCDGTAQFGVSPDAAVVSTTGTAYAPQTSPSPVDGSGCMRLDVNNYAETGTTQYYWIAELGPVTVGPLDLSSSPTTELVWACPSLYATGSWSFEVTLTDASSNSHTVGVTLGVGNQTSGWNWMSIALSSFSSIDLSRVVSWKIRFYTLQGTSTHPVVPFYFGEFRAFPASSTQASTPHGAVYKYANVLGDAQAPASITGDRGGSGTISGSLFYKAPSGTASTTPCLVGLTGSAPSTGTTAAPSTFDGTYRVILANGGGSNIAAGGTLTITQKVNGTTVATATVTAATVAGGSKWADCGDITLPLIDIPDQASNTTYSFSFSATATDVMLIDTRGFLTWVPVLPTAKPYVWVDESTAQGMGGVYAGSASDRSDATSLLGATGVQIAGPMSLDPGDNYLLAYCIDGAFSNVTVDYYDRYLGERTAV